LVGWLVGYLLLESNQNDQDYYKLQDTLYLTDCRYDFFALMVERRRWCCWHWSFGVRVGRGIGNVPLKGGQLKRGRLGGSTPHFHVIIDEIAARWRQNERSWG
jgi:hypothetical protein